MRKKRLISTLLASTMVASVALAGCSGDSNKGKTTNGDAQETKTIKIMAPLLAESTPKEGNEIQTALEEITGYKLDVTWVPNTQYSDRVSVTLNGNDLPDILVATGKDNSIISAVDAGAFWQLDDYIDEYPNLAKMDEDIQLNASFNGKTYGIYRSRDVMRAAIIIRRDWLENLDMEVPKTTEDFLEMLRAFKNDDPDGNGQDDTYGLTIPKWDGMNNLGPFDQIAVWFGAPNAFAVDEEGNVTPDFYSEGYNEALDFMKQLYDEGLINQDFVTLSTDDWNNDFINGKSGCIIDLQSRGMSIAGLMAEKYEVEPDEKGNKDGSEWVTMIANVSYEDVDAVLPTSGYAGMLLIPKSSVKTEEELKEVLTFIDKLNSDEAILLVNKGVEGLNYEFDENGNYVQLTIEDETKRAQNKADLGGYSQIGTNVTGYVLPAALTGFQLETERIAIRDGEDVKAKAVFNPVESIISETQNLKGATLKTIISDARIKYIAGQITREEYNQEIERWKSSGGEDILKEMTKLYKENILGK